MKKLKSVIIFIFSIIGAIILTLGNYALIQAIQAKLFLPKDYIIWIFKSPISRFVFIYELYFLFGVFYLFSKNVKDAVLWALSFKNNLLRKYKKSIIFIFIILNVVLIYTVMFDVTVITGDKIINYTFLTPQGREYGYQDVVNINTGVYGKEHRRLKGEFFYIIQLKDGTKIDLTEDGGTRNDEDPRFVIERLDKQYVNMGIHKVSSMDNFQYCTQNLAKIYTDKIKSILLNVK